MRTATRAAPCNKSAMTEIHTSSRKSVPSLSRPKFAIASHRPQTANGRFYFIESWRWQRKTLKTSYRDVNSNSQLPSLYAKHRASLFSRFSLLWCKIEERRLFLIRCRFAEACFGANRHRRRNKGRSSCITTRGFICFCKRIIFMNSLLQTQGWPCAPIRDTGNIHCAENNKLYEPSNKDNGAPDKPVRQFHLDLWLGSENLSVATT